MNNKVFIIHGASIVQYGLTDILNRNFRCTVKSFYSFDDFKKSELTISDNSVLFTEDIIANDDEYLKFMIDTPNIISYGIVSCADTKEQQNIPFAIYLQNTEDEIYEQVKTLFVQKQVTEEDGGLSSREIDVLKLVAKGFANKEIAEKLFISTHTVMSHRKKITEKLGVKSISGLTVYAIINNYIDTKNINIKDLI